MCECRKKGDSEHREAKSRKKEEEKATGSDRRAVKRAMRILNDLRGPQLVELFVLPVEKNGATGDTRERARSG